MVKGSLSPLTSVATLQPCHQFPLLVTITQHDGFLAYRCSCLPFLYFGMEVGYEAVVQIHIATLIQDQVKKN